MKMVALVFVAALLGPRERALRDVAPPSVEWGEPVNGVSVGLYFTKSEFRLGEPMEFTAFIKNESEEVLWVPNQPQTWYFDISATGKDRKPLANRSRASSGVVSTFPVQPGKTKAFDLDLNKFLVITNADEIVIAATHFFRDKTGDHSALSRNAVIRVLEGRTDASNTSSPASSSISQDSPTADLPNVIPEGTGNRSGRFLKANSAAVGNSSSVSRPSKTSPPLANASPVSGSGGFPRAQKLGISVAAALLLLLLAILWRASRRKQI